MAFEKLDATRLITFDPPLPRRGFPLLASESSTTADQFGGNSQDGRSYGKFTIDSTYWSGSISAGVPPMQVGERFQIFQWNTTVANHPFYPSTGPTGYGLNSGLGGAPDLQRTDYLIDGNGNTLNAWTLKYPTVRTVVGVIHPGDDTWIVYYSPDLLPSDGTSIDTTRDGIVTVPEPMNGVWLGTLAHEQGLNYSWDCPGGPSTLGFTLAYSPGKRVPALNPGRILQAFRGGSCIWEGVLQEPSPSVSGWDVTANGAGTYGQGSAAMYDSVAVTTGATPAYTNNAVDNVLRKSVGRGLRWDDSDGIGHPTGLYLSNAQDSGTMNVEDFLNQVTSGGSLYWSVEPPAGSKVPAGPWKIRIRPYPSTIDGNPLDAGPKAPEQFTVNEWQRLDLKAVLRRLPPDLYIINTNPIPRTVSNDYNSLVIKYQISPDIAATSTVKAQAAVFVTTVVDNPASVAKHGRNEYFLDITQDGSYTEAQVVALGQNVLTRYVRASFSQPFVVQPGQLLNNGGVPVDLGCNWVGRVATVQVENQAFGGEVNFGPITFLIGDYAYDDTSQTATLTPFQNQFTDISSVISQLYPGKFA